MITYTYFNLLILFFVLSRSTEVEHRSEVCRESRNNRCIRSREGRNKWDDEHGTSTGLLAKLHNRPWQALRHVFILGF
jgi:hypothetical protein